MNREQERIKLFNLNSSNRQIRNKMMKTLKFTKNGDYDRAARILKETRKEFDQIRNEHHDLFEQPNYKKNAYETESSFEFTEVLHDFVSQANRLQAHKCSAVKFHIYN